MRLADVAARYRLASPAEAFELDTEIGGISYDSRTVRPGHLFVAIGGTRIDGHEFVPAAFDQGAIAAIVSRPEAAAGRPALLAEDTREALAWAAAAFRGFPGRALDVVGVTGTNGKTTTTHLVEAAMLASGHPAGVVGTLGVRYRAGGLQTTVDLGFTTPQAPELQQILAMMSEAGVRQVAMEVSSHALDQHRAAHIGFAVGVFTNLTRDHLDYHRTEDAYAEAKAKLFTSLREGGAAVVNADDPRCQQMEAAARSAGVTRILTYGLVNPAALSLREIEMGPAGSRASVQTPAGRFTMTLQLPGRFNLYNALAALGAVMALDLDPAVALDAFAKVPGVPGRVERVSSPDADFAVMVDYAHTPDGLQNVLETIRGITSKRVIVVFGCGGDRDRTKRPLMGRIASDLADVAIVTSDNPRTEDPEAIIAEVRTGMTGPHETIVDRAEAIRRAISQARPGDTVVLAGKGHEPYQIIGGRRIAFDDREVARQALRELGASR